jgi:hypothetical protein
VFTFLEPPLLLGRQTAKTTGKAAAEVSAFHPLFSPYWGSETISHLSIEEVDSAAAPITPKNFADSPHSNSVGSALGNDVDDGASNDDAMDGMDRLDDADVDGGIADARDNVTLASVLGDADPLQLPCLLIPEPLLQLLARRQWTRLLLCIRWHATLRFDMDGRRCKLQG